MFAPELIAATRDFLSRARAAKLRVVTAESCTGGLIATLLTEIPGCSDVMERGFVTYSNESKTEALGVPATMIAGHGAVSAEVARAMALGALAHSRADMAVAVTGIAGPDGGTAQKPVGLVFIAAARGDAVRVEERRFGAIGRDGVRRETVKAALGLLAGLL